MSNPNQERSRWVKLSAETWDEICAQYAAGATARALAEKYGTSITSVYRHVVRSNMTKAKASDGAARARADAAEAWDEEEAAAEAAYVQRVALMSTSALTQHLERVSLNLLAEMLSTRRIADARALVAVMEALSRRALMERAHEEAMAGRESHDVRAAKEREAVDRFRVALHIAHHMLHDPENAPGIFVDLIAEWRRRELGEGDEAAIARARKDAAEARRYFRFPGRSWPKALAELGVHDGREDSVGEADAGGADV
jgi:hypothetical protein